MGPVAKQMTFMAIGIVAAYFIQYIPTWMLRLIGYAMLGISIICLYLILIPKRPFAVSVNEATRWFRLGPLSFQPSELAKLSLIIVIADLLARIKNAEDGKKYFFITLGVAGITIFPILVGNFSTAALIALIVVFMWFLSNVPGKYILSTLGIGVVVLVSGFFIVKYGYIEKDKKLKGPFARAVTWVNRVDEMFKEKNTSEAEFQITDYNRQRSIAKIAIMRGGRSPLGVLPGNSLERDFLPLAFADYIFAIYVEETGIIGVIVLILLYLAILFRACYASNKYEDYTAMLMVMGIVLLSSNYYIRSILVPLGQIVEKAKMKGYVETAFNRRRYLPELTASNNMLRSFGERVARNAPIQGTAADIIKIAMIKVYNRLKIELPNAKLILQVHDELIVEADESDSIIAAKILKEEMESAFKMEVPLVADVNIGKTWLEAKG